MTTLDTAVVNVPLAKRGNINAQLVAGGDAEWAEKRMGRPLQLAGRSL